MKAWREFALVLRLQNRQAWYHKSAAFASVLIWSMRLAITIALYRGLYQLLGKTSIHGVSFAVAISGMLLYAVFAIAGARSIYQLIDQEYRTGAIEIWLNKPVSYAVLKIAENAGRHIPKLMGGLLAVIAYWCVFGLPNQDLIPLRILCAVLFFFSGQVLLYLSYTLIGFSAVWLHDSDPIYLVADKILMIFGGIYIPIAFFPPWFRVLGESLPTGAAAFMTQIFYDDFFMHLPRFILTQLVWIALLGLALAAVSRALNRRLTVNGG